MPPSCFIIGAIGPACSATSGGIAEDIAATTREATGSHSADQVPMVFSTQSTWLQASTLVTPDGQPGDRQLSGQIPVDRAAAAGQQSLQLGEQWDLAGQIVRIARLVLAAERSEPESEVAHPSHASRNERPPTPVPPVS
jgi:hypothetical protein